MQPPNCGITALLWGMLSIRYKIGGHFIPPILFFSTVFCAVWYIWGMINIFANQIPKKTKPISTPQGDTTKMRAFSLYTCAIVFGAMPYSSWAGSTYDNKTKFEHRYERIAGDIVGIPVPKWRNTGANVTYTLNKGFTQFRIAPPRTDVGSAKQRQVITLMDVKPETTAQSYLDYLIEQDVNACGERYTMTQVWQKQDRYILVLLACGRTPQNKSHTRLLNIYQVQNKIITISHHWMGKPYQPNLSGADSKRTTQKMPVTNDDIQWFQSGASLKYCMLVDKNPACKPLKSAYDRDVKNNRNMMRYVLSRAQ